MKEKTKPRCKIIIIFLAALMLFTSAAPFTAYANWVDCSRCVGGYTTCPVCYGLGYLLSTGRICPARSCIGGQLRCAYSRCSNGRVWEEPQVPPNAPANVSALRLTETSARISWSASEYATSYRVERLTGSTWGNATTVSTTSATVNNVNNGDNFRVIAVNAHGSSSPAQTTIPQLFAPSIPPSLSYSGIEGVSDRAIISWGASNIPATYRAQFSDGTEWKEIPDYDGTARQFEAPIHDGKQFRVQAFNSAGDSAWAETTIKFIAPVFSQTLTDRTVNEGASVTFTTSASGFPYFTYQWQKFGETDTNWVNIQGETENTLILENITYDMKNTRYRLTAQNVHGTTSSDIAAIYVNAALKIETQPENTIVTENETATFSVQASTTDNGTIAYQWQRLAANELLWQDIQGATANTLTITNTAPEQDGNRYRVTVKSNHGAVISQDAELGVVMDGSKPYIETPPQTYIVAAEGQTVTFSALAIGDPPPTLQWQVLERNGGKWEDMENETQPDLVLQANQDMHHNLYRVVATNRVASTRSSYGILAVTASMPPPPTPAGLGAVQIANGQMRIFWSETQNADFYRVLHFYNGEWRNFAGYDKNSGETFFVTEEENNKQFRIIAVNEYGESEYAEVTYTAPDPDTPPDAPQLFRTADNQLTWNPVNGAVRYDVYAYVYREIGYGSGYFHVGTTTDTFLPPFEYPSRVQWFYQVQQENIYITAVNENGLTARSSTIDIASNSSITRLPLLGNDVNPPATPTGITGMWLNNNSALITWNPAIGATEYGRVHLSGSLLSDIANGIVHQRWASHDDYDEDTFEIFSPSRGYRYPAQFLSINARNIAGTSGAITIAGSAISQPQKQTITPASPENLSARIIAPNTARIKWDSVELADEYGSQLMMSSWSNLSSGVLRTFTDRYLSDSVTAVSVTAINEGGNSTPTVLQRSDILPMPAAFSAPSAPLGLSVISLAPNYARIMWNISFGADYYEIQFFNGNWSESVTTKNNSYGVINPTITAARVRAVNSAGASDWQAADYTQIIDPPDPPDPPDLKDIVALGQQLSDLIGYAQNLYLSTVISNDNGKDVPPDTYWATQEDYQKFVDSVDAAVLVWINEIFLTGLWNIQ